jgi:hypothetical protein
VTARTDADNRIRVLFVIGTLDVGGTERQLVEIASRLDRRRFAPMVCCLSRGGALVEALREAGVPTAEVRVFSGRTGRRAARRRAVGRSRRAFEVVAVGARLPSSGRSARSGRTCCTACCSMPTCSARSAAC